MNGSRQYRSHAKMDEIDPTSQEQMAVAQGALNMSWSDDNVSPAERFARFRALKPSGKAKLMAFATAATTNPCFARHPQSDSLMHTFENEVMPDIRAHWTPNAAFFNRLKKAGLLKILGDELGLTQEALALASSSKKDIVSFCDKLFADPFATLTEDQRAAVDRWCPPMMQTAGVEGADETDQGKPDARSTKAQQPRPDTTDDPRCRDAARVASSQHSTESESYEPRQCGRAADGAARSTFGQRTTPWAG